MSCDEEFGLYLAARPEYTAYGSQPINPAYENGYFRCSNGEERAYYRIIVIPDCDLEFAQFLADNPIFMAGNTPVNDEPNPIVQRFQCPMSSEARWYGYTVEANYDRLIREMQISGNADAFTLEGQAFFESERRPGDTIDVHYARYRSEEYFVGRFFAADGSYRAFVRKGSRYHLFFPQYIIPTPPA